MASHQKQLEAILFPARPKTNWTRYPLCEVADFMNWKYLDAYNGMFRTSLKDQFSDEALSTRKLSAADAAIFLFACILREHRWPYDEICRHIGIFKEGVSAYKEDRQKGRPGPWMLMLNSSVAGADALLRGPDENSRPLHTFGPAGYWLSIEAVLALLQQLDNKLNAEPQDL
ncbi:MAG: hypothetical protein ACRD4B_09170 [Acidobacteriota bacterium]